MKRKRFMQNALILTIATIFLRGVGTAFSIYVSNRVGAEGMGLYQLVSSVYFMAITLATSGISIAVTRLVSEQMALKNTRSARSAFRRCIAISLGLGSAAGVLLFCAAAPVGIHFLQDGRTVPALRLLSIGLPFLSVSSVIRGYFLGMRKPFLSASGDIVEQMVTVGITIPVLTAFLPKGLTWACCGLVIGSIGAEILSCLYSVFAYLATRPKQQGSLQPHMTRRILEIAVPVAAGNYIRSLLTTIENALVPSGLRRYGANSSAAMSQYGMIKGMAMPVLTFPSVIMSAFASLLVPEVAGAKAVNDQKRIDYMIDKCFKATLLFAFLITGLFFRFSHEIAGLLYENPQVGELLFMLTPLIPLLYLDQIVDSILKGLNQQVASMKYNTADSVMRVALIALLVPLMGVKGYLVMFYAGTIFNASMSINRLLVVGQVKFQTVEWLLKPLAAITAACLVSRLLSALPLLCGILLVLCVYLLCLFLFGSITRQDVHWAGQIFGWNEKGAARRRTQRGSMEKTVENIR